MRTTRQLVPTLALVAVVTAALLAALATAQTAPPVTLSPATQPAAAAPTTQLTGTTYGTAGSWANDGNTIAKATDGNLATFFDAPTAGGNVGIDLGSAQAVTQIRFAPRAGYASRMVGGMFQYSTSPTFAAGITTVYTVSAAPAQGVLTTVPVSAPVERYWRYLGPANGYGNIAEFQLFGPAAVATPAATVVTLPPPLPLTGIVCGCGPTAAATATYAAGQAPCVAWLDARPFTVTRTDRLLWHLPRGSAAVPDPRHVADPVKYPAATVDPDNSLAGQVVAAEFDSPGTYPVTVGVSHADGTTATYGVSVVVAPEVRTYAYFGPTGNDANAGTTAAAPKLSAAAFVAAAQRSNEHVVLLPGYAASLACGPVAAVALGTNTVVDGQADASGNRPVLTIGNYAAFYAYHTSSQDDLVRGVTVTSSAALGGSGRPEMLIDSGINIVLSNCGFGTLTRAAEMDDSAVVADGFGVLGCQQLSPTAIGGQVLYGGVGGRVCWDFNTFTGATAEAICRFEGVGAGNGASVELDLIEQTNPAAGDKAGVDDRNSVALVVAHNGYVNCQESHSTSDGTTATTSANCLSIGNVYRVATPVPFTGWVQVKDRSAGLTFAGDDFGPGQLDAIDLSTAGGVSSVVLAGNAYASGLVPLRVAPAAAVPGLVSDVAVVGQLPATQPAATQPTN